MRGLVEFLSQGGYAFFVWSAFGMTFALLVGEVMTLRHNRRTILRRVGRLARLRARTESPPEP
ncbi:MAG: heme exporter protein CcmD [Thiohalocapsa sp.]|jgi:heme exporter protein D